MACSSTCRRLQRNRDIEIRHDLDANRVPDACVRRSRLGIGGRLIRIVPRVDGDLCAASSAGGQDSEFVDRCHGRGARFPNHVMAGRIAGHNAVLQRDAVADGQRRTWQSRCLALDLLLSSSERRLPGGSSRTAGSDGILLPQAGLAPASDMQAAQSAPDLRQPSLASICIHRRIHSLRSPHRICRHLQTIG